MNRSEQCREELEQLEQLFHELRAINLWDRAFFSAEKPDLIEFIAWENRRKRVFQIYQQLFFRLNHDRGSVCREGTRAPDDDDG